MESSAIPLHECTAQEYGYISSAYVSARGPNWHIENVGEKRVTSLLKDYSLVLVEHMRCSIRTYMIWANIHHWAHHSVQVGMVHQKVPGTGQLPDTGSSPTPVVDGQSQSTNSATTQATNGIGDEAANKLVEVCLSLPDPSHFRAIFKPLVTVMPRGETPSFITISIAR